MLHASPNAHLSVAKGLLGGSGRRGVAHTRPAFLKIPTAPSAFPLLGVPQALGDEPSHSEGGKNLGGRPPEPEGNLQVPRYTWPDPFRSKHGRPKRCSITILFPGSVISLSNLVLEESMMQVSFSLTILRKMNSGRNYNLITQSSVIDAIQILSERIRNTKYSGISRYK